MATEVLAPGTTAAQSADIVLAAPNTLLLLAKGPAGAALTVHASLLVEVKTSNNTWLRVGAFGTSNEFFAVLHPGTYRVRRLAGAVSIGADTA